MVGNRDAIEVQDNGEWEGRERQWKEDERGLIRESEVEYTGWGIRRKRLYWGREGRGRGSVVNDSICGVRVGEGDPP